MIRHVTIYNLLFGTGRLFHRVLYKVPGVAKFKTLI